LSNVVHMFLIGEVNDRIEKFLFLVNS